MYSSKRGDVRSDDSDSSSVKVKGAKPIVSFTLHGSPDDILIRPNSNALPSIVFRRLVLSRRRHQMPLADVLLIPEPRLYLRQNRLNKRVPRPGHFVKR